MLDQSGSSYSHLSNVSTLAALFSMATGIGDPEDLALAGLFHDIGLSAVPADVQDKPDTEWTLEERRLYQGHPEHSLNLVKGKSILTPEQALARIKERGGFNLEILAKLSGALKAA